MEEVKRTCTPEEVQNRDGEIDLVDVCRALLSKALSILLATVICAVGGILYAVNARETTYTSTATVYMADGSMASTGNVAIATYLARDYATMIPLRTVLDAVISNLGLENEMSYEQLAKHVEVGLEHDGRVVTIQVTDQYQKRAVRLAEEIFEVSRAKFAEQCGEDRARLLDPPHEGEANDNGGIGKAALIAGLAGFVLSALFVVILYMYDGRLRDAAQTEKLLGVGVMGVIPRGEPTEKR